jgi:site-specific DNA-methyltransferase (adenine-specific)
MANMIKGFKMKELNKIYCGDCFDYLKDIPNKTFDLLLIDPPYAVFKTSIGGDKPFGKGKTSIGGGKLCKVKEYSPIDWDIELSQEQINELIRVSKNQIIFGFEHLYTKLPKSKGIYCWDKKHGENLTFSEFELIWTSFNFPTRFIRFKWNGMLKDNYEVEKCDKVHPTQKPVEIIKILLKNHAKKGDLVLDCFNGSGTTTLACKQLNIDFIGIELSQEYCDIANKRLCQSNLLTEINKENFNDFHLDEDIKQDIGFNKGKGD